MSIKCSVLGHSFGSATVERDRSEQGSEVVITIREVEACSRCGEERVVSENKEVTAIETADDVVGDDPVRPSGESNRGPAAGTGTDAAVEATDDAATTGDSGAADPPDGPAASADDGASTPDGADAATSADATGPGDGSDGATVTSTPDDAGSGPADETGQPVGTDGPADAGGVDEAATTPTTDDAEILDSEPAEGPDDELSDPSVEEGTAFDGAAEREEEDAIIIGDDGEESEPDGATEAGGDAGTEGDGDASGAGTADHDESRESDESPESQDAGAATAGGAAPSGDTEGRAPGEWPTEPDGRETPEWADARATDESTTDRQGPAVTVPDGEFRCPECGYRTDVESSSLRAGDFCPDCHRGSLVHEPDQ